MIAFLKIYAISVLVFFVLDMLWLGVVAKGFYQKQIGHLLRVDVNWIAAGAFYLVFLAGVVTFVIQPAIDRHSIQYAVSYGALFGLVTYAACDLDQSGGCERLAGRSDLGRSCMGHGADCYRVWCNVLNRGQTSLSPHGATCGQVRYQ